MDCWTQESEASFSAYVDHLATVIGHADRVGPLRDYGLGPLMPLARKSVEPIAAVTAPARVAAKHQSLLHFVGQASWSDAAVLAQVRDHVMPLIERHGPVRAWIVDDTGFPQEGPALGRRGAAVLWSDRQAGQLPGGGDPVGGQ